VKNINISEIQPSEWLKWICSSENIDELRENYDKWADTYDVNVGDVWGTVPLAAADLLAEYIDDKQDIILDVGAGTGLVGVALARLGFEQLIGIDISPAMLTKAAKRGIYRSLVCCSIGDESFMNLEKASGIIATGVFAENHAGPAELSTLQESLKPEGVLVFTVRRSFLPDLQEVLERWILLDSKVMPIYDDPIHLLSYKIQATYKS